MILFWISSALVAAAALALALRPLMRRRAAGEGAPAGPERDRLNLAVHRDQLRELDADRAAGKLAPADYEQARLEIEKRLLEDVAAVVPGAFISRSETRAPSASRIRTPAWASRSSRSSRWSSAWPRG